MTGFEISRDRLVPDDVERILTSLPDWFGIEEAVANYVEGSRTLPTYAATTDHGVVGILQVKRHTESGAEVYLLAVEPAFHGKGVGSALLGMAELDLAADGFQFLQVKTLGPSEGDPFYERTRGFYERRGFVQLEEIKDFWDDEPALILVKQLLASANPTIAAGTSPPRLIHLNGPSGVGKSTIAQQYADRNPGVLNLDLDLLRPLVGGWRHDFESTGSLTRILGLDMATTHLRTGRDVVVPQLVARLDELVRFEEAARTAGAAFVEVMVTADREVVAERLRHRGSGPLSDVLAQVHQQLEGTGAVEAAQDVQAGLDALHAERPGLLTLTTSARDVVESTALLEELLDW